MTHPTEQVQEQVQKFVHTISDVLDGLTLNELLERFKPDKYMAEQLEGYLPVWGDRPTYEFVEGVLSSGPGDEPDIWNGDMKPYNILQILDTLYRAIPNEA